MSGNGTSSGSAASSGDAPIDPVAGGIADAADEPRGIDVPRVPTAVELPDPETILHHNLTGHCSYMPWCEACVTGRARQPAHRTVTGDQVHEVAVDYADLGTIGSKKHLLVVKCGFRQW